jgi:hypothetical protein
VFWSPKLCEATITTCVLGARAKARLSVYDCIKPPPRQVVLLGNFTDDLIDCY